MSSGDPPNDEMLTRAGRLVRALEDAGAPPYMIQKARDGGYDLFRSTRVNPHDQNLIGHARKLGLSDIARRVQAYEPREVEWQHRWFVRAHWRQQRHPTTDSRVAWGSVGLLVHRPDVLEPDGSLVLVAEPTRMCVPCPQCGELSRRQVATSVARSIYRGVARRSICASTAVAGSATCQLARARSLPSVSMAHWPATPADGTTELLTTFALQAGGDGGARLARKAGVPVSPDTLLRLMHALTDADDQRGPGFWVLTIRPCAGSNAGTEHC